MSLLLDALNKADQERKRSNEAAPGIDSNHEHRHYHGARNHSLLLVAVVIVSLLILLAAIYWLGQRSTATQVTSATAPVNTIANAPQTNNHTAPKKTLVTSEPKTSETKNTDAAAPAATEIDTSDENVASLYQNTQVPQSNAAATISPPTAEAIPTVPEAAPVAVPNIASPVSIAQFSNLPEIHDLPTSILERIPSLGYSEHHYNINGGNVKINGEIKHVNDQLPNGIVIDKILEDGMILHIDNYSFKMRAMNSWVNM